MSYKNLNSSNTGDVLILTNEVTFNEEILKIKKLIKKKYLILDPDKQTRINEASIENISLIKNTTLLINKNIKEEKLKIFNDIKDNEIKLKLFKTKKKNLSNEFIKLQQKKYSIQLKVNNAQYQTIINNNKKIEILENNNNELKNEINKIKEKNYLEKKNLKFDELNQKTKFYQNENISLSSKLSESQKKITIANENLSKIENVKNRIFNQIQELQSSFNENNVISDKFKKKKQGYIKPAIEKNTDVNLNKIISEIFNK